MAMNDMIFDRDGALTNIETDDSKDNICPRIPIYHNTCQTLLPPLETNVNEPGGAT